MQDRKGSAEGEEGGGDTNKLLYSTEQDIALLYRTSYQADVQCEEMQKSCLLVM